YWFDGDVGFGDSARIGNGFMRGSKKSVIALLLSLLLAETCLGEVLNKELERYYERAREAFERKDYVRAAEEYQRIVGLAPGLAEARSNLGMMLHLQEKFDEAVPHSE